MKCVNETTSLMWPDHFPKSGLAMQEYESTYTANSILIINDHLPSFLDKDRLLY